MKDDRTMKCPKCRQAKIIISSTCTGLELGCPGCGHIFPPEEARELIARMRQGRGGEENPPAKAG
jgi:rubredoxin